jgi:5-methylcytosine-specific restriction endonuclease McrA
MATSQWHVEHREYLRVKGREYARSHREERTVYMRKWREKNRQKMNEQRRAHYLKNTEVILQKQRQWWQNNPDKAKALYQKNIVRARQWRHKNPVKVRIKDHRRRERVRTTLDKSAINILSQLVSSSARLKCAICDKNMPKSDRTIDHVIPLSKGGTGDIWNLSIVHRMCNILKAAKMPDELNFARDGAQPKKNIRGRGEREATSESTFPRAANEQKKEA